MSKKNISLSEEKVLKQLGARIRSLRKEKGYTSHESFAYEFDLNRAQHGRHERGTDMRMSSIIKLCNALGVTLAEFFAEGFD